MNNFIFLLVAIFSLLSPSTVQAQTNTQLITTNQVSFTHPVKSSRNAAVKIISPDESHGSGIYVTYKKQRGILTAAHVVDSGSIYKIKTDTEEVLGVVVWTAKEDDVAFLVVQEEIDREPIKLAVSKSINAGLKVSYSGYPSSYELLSVNGQISGFDSRGYILMQGFGWFGASGSGVIDRSDKIVGVVTALPVENFYGHPQVLETLILLTPFKEEHLNQIEQVLKVIH
jgi:S1-C subfamily serine protease